MKEILKDICKKVYDKHSLERANRYFDYIFNCEIDEYYNYDTFYYHVFCDFLEEVICKDFEVKKQSFTIKKQWYFRGKYSSDIDIQMFIYSIPSKKINIVFVDKKDYPCYTIKNEFLKYQNAVNSDYINVFYKNMENVDDQHLDSTNDIIQELNIVEILGLLYGVNDKLVGYYKVISKYNDMLQELYNKPLSHAYIEKKDVVLKAILREFDVFPNKFQQSDMDFLKNSIRNNDRYNADDCSDDDISLFARCLIEMYKEENYNKVLNFIGNSSKSETYIRLLLTYIYSSKHLYFPNELYLDYLDFTYIAVGMFKLAEIIFNDLLNIYWGNKVIEGKFKVENGYKYVKIDLSKDDLELGKMEKFLYSTDEEISNHLLSKSILVDMLRSRFNFWKNFSRNGFLHKCIIDTQEKLTNSVRDSIDIIILLILTLVR